MDELVLHEAAGKQILWSNAVVSDASSDESRHRGVQLLDHASRRGCKPRQHEHSEPYDHNVSCYVDDVTLPAVQTQHNTAGFRVVLRFSKSGTGRQSERKRLNIGR